MGVLLARVIVKFATDELNFHWRKSWESTLDIIKKTTVNLDDIQDTLRVQADSLLLQRPDSPAIPEVEDVPTPPLPPTVEPVVAAVVETEFLLALCIWNETPSPMVLDEKTEDPNKRHLPSLKLTYSPPKLNPKKRRFLLETTIFGGANC